jgi:hypothetical protein
MALRGVATQANTTSTTTGVVTVSGIGGTGPLSGDIVFLCVNWGGGGGATFTYPSGFAAVTNCPNANVACGNGSGTSGIAWKLAGAGEPSTYTVTSTQNSWGTVHCRVYSGRAASPFVVAPVATGPVGSVVQPVTLSITGLTANAGDDVVLFVPNQSLPNTTDTLSFTPPTGFGNSSIAVAAGVSFSAAIMACDYVNYPGGATGTLGGTLNDTEGHTTGYEAYLISLAQTVVVGPILMGGICL